jgi:hypothetical protein
MQTSGKPCREKAKLCLEMATQAPHTRCRHPRRRVIQYAAASRLKHDYSGAAPIGGPPGGRCKKVIVAYAPSHEPIAAKAT